MENHGGTDEDVYLVICGMNGESQPIKINEKDKLNPSNVVKLDVSTNTCTNVLKEIIILIIKEGFIQISSLGNEKQT